MNYIFTVDGSQSEEDAIDFLIGILETEYSDQVSEHARKKGFKRIFAQTNDEIDTRLRRMSINSPGEYAYNGSDGKTRLAIYTFWGII